MQDPRRQTIPYPMGFEPALGARRGEGSNVPHSIFPTRIATGLLSGPRPRARAGPAHPSVTTELTGWVPRSGHAIETGLIPGCSFSRGRGTLLLSRARWPTA